MTETAKAARRPYRPPQLEKVELVVEEAVLQMCKVGQKRGPGGDTCIITGAKCVDPGT